MKSREWYTNHLTDIMAEHNLNQRQFAALIGVHYKTIYKWKSGKTKMSYDHWRRMVELFEGGEKSNEDA